MDVPADEAPKVCSSCDGWNEPHEPFQVHGDTWYVGPEGISVLAVRTSAGVVLFDGALPQSVEGVVANLRTVGLDIADVRYIFVSHAHYDHVGGVAALQRRSGATVVSTATAADSLRLGNARPGDPLFSADPEVMAFPPVVGSMETLTDGASVTLGDTTFTLHATPGHTLGGASYTWTSCVGQDCRSMVYVDSLTAVSFDGFQFSADPERVAAFESSIDTVAAMPCDAMVSVHPDFDAIGEPACATYAKAARKRLGKRLRKE